MRMTKIRLLLLVMSLFLLIPAAIAQETIIVTPDTGAIGEAFEVVATGLMPDTAYDMEFILMAENEVVYTTSRTTDSEGVLTMTIFSDPSDAPGHYQVKLLDSNGDPINSAIFVLTEADPASQESQPEQESAPEDNSEQPEQAQPEQPSQGSIEVRILPRVAPAGTTHNIFITGLEPEQTVIVAIVQDATGSEVYSNQFTATDTGRLDVEIFSTLDDAPGNYTVSVRDSARNELATIGMTLEEPTGRDGVLSIEPANANAGDTQTLTLSDVNAFRDFDVRIENAENGELIYQDTFRANADGIATLEYLIEPDTPDGLYTVTIIEETSRAQVAEGQIAIGDVEMIPATISISPESGDIATAFDVEVANLQSGTTFTFEIIFAETGEVVFSAERTAEADGTYSTMLGVSDTDPNGTYNIVARQGDTTLAEGTLTIIGNDTTAQVEEGITVNLSPAVVQPGDSLIVTARGLEAGERVTVEISNGEAIIFSDTTNADINGAIAMSVDTHPDDDEGTYTVSITRGEEVVASTELALGNAETTAESTEETDQQADTEENGIAVTVDPTGGELGTDYTITVSGLSAEEIVTVDILLDGESAYSANITADADGVALLQITSEATDPVGQYTAAVTRDGVEVGSAQFGVGEDLVADSGDAETVIEAEPFNGTITITPDRGGRNTRHEVIIEGLNPNETVTLQVSMGAIPVYTTERTADASGMTSLALRTSETDAAGVYTVSILRPAGEDMQSVGSANFTVTREVVPGTTTEQSAPESTVSVDISPASGAIGTTHTVTVSGLEAGETVTLDVLYDDSVEYTTERTADSDGSFILDLAASPQDPTGIYTVQVSRDGDVIASGELNVLVMSATAQTPSSTADSAIPGSLTINNPEDRYVFQGAEGDVMYITLVSDDFDAYLVLQDEYGSILTTDDDSGGNLNSAIGPFILPYDGTFTVISSSYDYYNYGEIVEGDFSLTISTTTLNTIASGVPTSVTFGDDQGAAFYSLEAEEGDRLMISVEGDGVIDTRLQLRDPSGYIVAEDDDSGDGFDPEISRYIVQTAGTYILSVQPFYSNDSGTVTVTVEQSPARFIDDAPASVTLNNKLYSEMLRVSANDGETILLSLEQVRGDLGDVYITVTQDDTTLASFYAARLPDSMPLAVLSQSDSPMNILIESSFGSGELTVSISN
ncbi:MAG: PPC domain-containing protein [Anaerolineaceae bacterium]|nr:PPC domain-containing protein [Anaerolineaceae bacterium]